MPAPESDLPNPITRKSTPRSRQKEFDEAYETITPWGTKDKTYVRVPVKALNLLADLKQYKAQRLLLALCTYMDFNNHTCWPSYPAIMERSGLRKNDIKANLDLLVEFKFIKVRKKHMGGEGISNFYTITDVGYLPHLWECDLRATLPISAVCGACAKPLRAGDYSGKINGRSHHFGCGGQVIIYSSKKQAKRHFGKKPPV